MINQSLIDVRCFHFFSNQTSYIKNYLLAEDTLNTLNIVEQLGAKINRDGSSIEITPIDTLIEPNDVLDCGNSGTAMIILWFISKRGWKLCINWG